jgi:hypothetical protein
MLRQGPDGRALARAQLRARFLALNGSAPDLKSFQAGDGLGGGNHLAPDVCS